MQPTTVGQVVKYKDLFPGEDPNQKYIILEIHFDVEKPRALIKELNGNKIFASTCSRLVEELEVVEVDTTDLLGYETTIDKTDNTQAKGKVVKVNEQKVMLDLAKRAKGVETNVWITIQDEHGKEHTGTLFVEQWA